MNFTDTKILELDKYLQDLHKKGYKIYRAVDPQEGKIYKTWAIVTDSTGEKIAYVQSGDFGGIKLSTKHKPNQTTGTGFQVDGEDIEKAFVIAPSWTKNKDIETVKKYKNIEEYKNQSYFKYELQNY